MIPKFQQALADVETSWRWDVHCHLTQDQVTAIERLHWSDARDGELMLRAIRMECSKAEILDMFGSEEPLA